MKVDDYLTFVGHADDLPFLRTKFLNVNMRLFLKSEPYRCLVKNCCDVIRRMALSQFDDYSQPFGMSGANVGIPFNVIGIVRHRKTDKEYCEIMINPSITRAYGGYVKAETNCGSIRLSEPIRVNRYQLIDLEWYDEDGGWHMSERISPTEGGLTIQHEVDHNLGILITDLDKKE